MALRRASAILAFCACVAGCATTDGEQPSLTRATTVPAEARAAVTIGRSTKAEILAALGKTAAIVFESGYEVWVYRLRDAVDSQVATAEFVLLFDPAGVLAKTRIRPSPSSSPLVSRSPASVLPPP